MKECVGPQSVTKIRLIFVVTILTRVDGYVQLTSRDLCYLDSGPSRVNLYYEGLTTKVIFP